jgi:hypothetical protein
MDIYGTLIYVVINQFMLHTPKKTTLYYSKLGGWGRG